MNQMYLKVIRRSIPCLLLFGGCCFSLSSQAQMSLSGQLRTRTEIRDGYANLNPIKNNKAGFTSQRTRLNFGYKWDRLVFNISAQDIRVWGQDASSINSADGNRLMLHEAWADIILMNANDTTIKTKFFDNMSLKIGRQELLYDDSRLLGNLDWLQQARRHDAVVLKTVHKGWQLDLGAGFNQNNDNAGVLGTRYLAGNVPLYVTNSKGTLVLTPAMLIPLAAGGSASANSSKAGTPVLSTVISTNGMNQEYKSMQFAYISKKFGQTKFAGLFFKDDFGKFRLDSIGSIANGFVYGRKYDVTTVNKRMTYGGLLSGTIGNASGLKKSWTAGAYFQSGKNKDGKKLLASTYTASLMLQKGNYSFGPGIDYLSGNDGKSTSTTDHRFDPLYGTPHKFYGNMDYFYAGSGSAVGGLINPYFKTKFTAKDLIINLDAHNFLLAENTLLAGTPIKKNLGYEFDLVTNYTLNKFTTVEFGYSYMSANNSMEFVKKSTINLTDHSPQWAYLMINIRPDFLFTKPVAIKQ